MLHELLTRRRDEIISRCERKLQLRHPNRPMDEVVNTLPSFIDELIKVERREGGIPEETPLPVDVPQARPHGEQRFRRGFPISEIAMDFGAISDTIGEIAIEEDFHLDPRSYRLLNECLDRAIATALDEYFELSRVFERQGVAEWIGSLGHELRNALSSASMAFDVLKTGQVGITSQTARVLERSLRRLGGLIGQTLATVQLRSGKQIAREHLCLREVIEDVVAAAFVDRGISVRLCLEDGHAIDADPNLLESALSNVVQNAIKFTRADGQIEIRSRTTETGTVIEIEDECGGLRGQDPEELFAAFVQGDQKLRGVGLGLAITRQAIEAHGGRIEARDLSPKGCVFSIYLPRGA